MHGGLQLCIESYVLWPFKKTKEEKEHETEDESLEWP